MRIGDFIEANVDAIVHEWVDFARTIDVGGMMDLAALRDHAAEILRATVADMRSPQTEAELEAKGKGKGADRPAARPLIDASALHAANRLGWGFDLPQVVSEYRALRASVLRLWMASVPRPSAFDLEDVTRFNEAMDQSLAKTIGSYGRGVDQARETFLGVLGHDLRQPLSAISVYAQVALKTGCASPESRQAIDLIGDGVREMSNMIGVLLDFTRTRLGSGIPIRPVPADFAALGRSLIDECRAVYPNAVLRLDVSGDSAGTWDAPRLRQAVANLLANACRHGRAGGTVTLAVDGTDPAAVRLAVNNPGDPIPPAGLARIFDPMTRGRSTSGDAEGPTGSVGLGLFVAREVARAHGGTIDVASTAEAGTTFTIRLPRHAPAPRP